MRYLLQPKQQEAEILHRQPSVRHERHAPEVMCQECQTKVVLLIGDVALIPPFRRMMTSRWFSPDILDELHALYSFLLIVSILRWKLHLKMLKCDMVFIC